MRARLLLLAPLLVAATACADGDNGAGDPDKGPGSAATVELHDAGAAPRQELRIQPSDDCEEARTNRQHMRMVVSVGGESERSTSTSEMDIRFKCVSVSAERIDATLDYEDWRLLDADPSTRAVLEDVLDAFQGAQARVVVNELGNIEMVQPPEVSFPGVMRELGEQMIDGIASQASSLATPFPEESVGLGARWQVTSEADMSGLRFRQSMVLTLASVDGDRVTADVDIQVEFIPGPIEVPGGGQEGQPEVLRGTMTGSGSITWMAGGLQPTYELRMEGTTVMAIDADGERLELTQQMTQETSSRER